ncbi:flagellar export chaperone FliS [Sulfidibacter corallicola]|uniref:Flagellar export chaperone FliS n=1 Tax=Sulfidibacter corallicola TaxID=2818388 RepID=A0A8A4TVG5_SULCO|nr:flagellar export chaperone FliS [Sulfidibacter corallicola]QTD53357.1 flagellar export chaperone FliS [Sulfidibacter corallicola]
MHAYTGKGNYSSTYSANAYRTNSVNTSPLQLVVMCYDGMLRFIKQTRDAIEKNNIEEKVKFLNKTLAIIDELQGSLDFKRGGDVARNLDRVYTYFANQLMKVGMRNDLKILAHVEKLIGELRSAWAKIANDADNQGAPQTPKFSSSNFTMTG